MVEEKIFLEVKKFYEEQYDTVKRLVEKRTNELAKERVKNNAIQWGMSVLFFAYQIGGNYFNLTALYVEYKNKIESL
jgi:hypothetical protein